jgi:3'(2'), 5'-bisphosphate nucleotidase
MVTREVLDRVTALAEEAGAAAMAHYGTGGAVELKADRSPVTEADRASHAVIVAGLAALDARVPVVSEEGEIPPYEVRRAWRRFWLVDPLDGTKEFLQQNGEFTVNIALVHEGVPVLGVVVAPARGLVYAAGAGLGAWKRERGGAARRLPGPPPVPPEGLTVVESRSHPSTELEAWLAGRKVARRVQAGSSLKFGLVAEGAAHCYPRLGPTWEWDTAAGDCVWRDSTTRGRRTSPLRYNTPELKNASFVIGLTA